MADKRLILHTTEPTHFPWPEDCLVQGGANGVVFSRDKNKKTYRTAFVEACPGGTFLRGEGKTIAEAEVACWKQYEVYASCEHTMGFERRQYTNGAGFCKECGTWMSKVFEPLPEDPDRELSEIEKAFADPGYAEKLLARISIVKDGHDDPEDELNKLDG